ncbi:hypothetical protein Cs7R123_29300 [Catellatospora sp. TT07R-123]|uniref:coiled-coil domain-containing protein n=1 Tax=Catellatospora sp. TT07R-123 TaxID=2733863 RepID=UPI001B17C970|nr:hypothetical protein [Catellatospora sp. TT07R-123]GHJ45588.1 hypothetical protein Cs7R123_29300 [Catellatospora sp. TT07R-123]
MTPNAPRRRAATAALLLAAVTMLLTGLAPAAPALAEPPNEGSSSKLAQLRENLDSAAKGYLEAQATLEASQTRQKTLNADLALAEADLVGLKKLVAVYAAEAYKTSRLGTLSLMISGGTPGSLLERASAMDRLTERDQSRLAALTQRQREITDAKTQLEAEIKTEQAALADMEKRKKAAEKALQAVVGGGGTTGYINPNSALAKPAPRNSDGSWPKETCSIDDPTTSGCITPRTLWAMKQAKAAGFNHYVSCHRSGGDGEHPKGRACDFAAAVGGFENASASGANKTYGAELASFFIKNASRLGIMYVIWYCKIWVNGAWKSYSSAGSNCGDSPAGDHTNHVHVSVL